MYVRGFTGILRKGYKVKMTNGAIRKLKPSMIPRGMWITVFYVQQTAPVAGKKTAVNEIFTINFLN